MRRWELVAYTTEELAGMTEEQVARRDPAPGRKRAEKERAKGNKMIDAYIRESSKLLIREEAAEEAHNALTGKDTRT